jgi:hypothetical protein
MSCADETGQQNLRRQFWFLLLHSRFARLQQLPFFRKALERGRERLHLHFQFDALAPEKLASLFLRMLRRWLLLIALVGLSMLLMVLVMKVLVLVELLLVVHEESGFLSASIGTQEDTRATAKGDNISPSCFVQI